MISLEKSFRSLVRPPIAFAVCLWLGNVTGLAMIGRPIFCLAPHEFMWVLIAYSLPRWVSLLVLHKFSRIAAFKTNFENPQGKFGQDNLIASSRLIVNSCDMIGLFVGTCTPYISGIWVIAWMFGGRMADSLVTNLVLRYRRDLPGQPFEMDESPLKDEILSVCAACRVWPEAILVQATRYAHKTPPLRSDLGRWWSTFNVRRPLIPYDFMRGMDSGVLTAGLAAKLAQHTAAMDLFGIRGIKVFFRGPGARGRIASLLLFAVVFVGIIILSIQYKVPSSTIQREIGFQFVVSILALNFIFERWRRAFLKQFVQSAKYLSRCVELWREADPKASRTDEDYLAARFQIYQRLNPDLSGENVLRMLFGQEAVAAYLAQIGTERAEEIVETLQKLATSTHPQ
ncbi:hypothetical protein HYR69_01840 [Candidatus Sumerlaeota bacterium]|nr:hypothetical protein [Candidatus Sumerlaeota bacterium]